MTRRSQLSRLKSAAGAAVVIALGLVAAQAAAEDLVLHAGRLIDGTGAPPRGQVSILVHDGRVTAVKDGFVAAPAGTRLIDLSRQTVLPGLIDAHVHVLAAFHGGDPIRNAVTRTTSDDLIDGVNNARADLLAGFTSLRDVGGDIEATRALKKASAAGTIVAPRLWIAGSPLGPTGGHGDAANGLDPELSHPGWTDNLIDGPESARKAVRTLRREGADLIKIMPSGGVMSIGDDPRLQLMADEEIKAVIDTAHALGMKVAAHAHGKAAIDHTLALGVDSIEHGTLGDAESFALYKSHHAWLVPTLLVADRGSKLAQAHPEAFNPSSAAKAIAMAAQVTRMIHDAHAAGVQVAYGTDTFGISAHGENAQEFALLVAAGFTPMEAILTATRNAAQLVGDEQDIGSVQPGRWADIIAVSGDPLSDVRVLETVDFVMKGGRVYKTAGKPVL